jgi:hypothetical protein
MVVAIPAYRDRYSAVNQKQYQLKFSVPKASRAIHHSDLKSAASSTMMLSKRLFTISMASSSNSVAPSP